MNGGYINPRRSAVVVVAFVLLAVIGAVLLGQPSTCSQSVSAEVDVIVVVDGKTQVQRVRLSGVAKVPCGSKPPSSARVETRINPNPIDRSQVDMDRNAVEGRW